MLTVSPSLENLKKSLEKFYFEAYLIGLKHIPNKDLNQKIQNPFLRQSYFFYKFH